MGKGNYIYLHIYIHYVLLYYIYTLIIYFIIYTLYYIYMYVFFETPSLCVLEFGKMIHHPRDDPLETGEDDKNR